MKFIPNSVALKAGRTLLKTQKNAPHLLFAGGVIGVVTSAVMACKATLRLEDEVLIPAQKDLANIDELKHKLMTDGTVVQTDEQRQKNIAHVYMRSAKTVVRLYGPAVVVGALSIGALTKSHNILVRRNAALAAAYTAISESFSEYRQRVVDELGEDKDREFRYGSETVTVTDENGKKKKITRVPQGKLSGYARFFDESAARWSPDPDYNISFLEIAQDYWNKQLDRRGYVFLNEVYDHLGLPWSTAGQAVGWYRGNPGGTDGYIDFGFTNKTRPGVLDFVKGDEASILLDFNVDGPIMDLL